MTIAPRHPRVLNPGPRVRALEMKLLVDVVILFLGLIVFCVMAGCWQFIQHMTMKLAW